LRSMRNVLRGDEGETEEVVESQVVSDVRSSEGADYSPSASLSSASPFSADSSDEQREENVQAARCAEVAIQQASMPW
jgi:hypothetical protein